MEKNKLMMIVIIVLLVVLLGTIVGISFYVLNVMQNPEETEITPPPVKEVQWEDLTTFSVGEITRNLLPEDDKNHILKATYSFEINTTDDTEGLFMATLNNKIDMVRSIINSVVGNITYTEVRSVNGMDRLKEQILEKVRETFQTNLIWDMNISSIYYQ